MSSLFDKIRTLIRSNTRTSRGTSRDSEQPDAQGSGEDRVPEVTEASTHQCPIPAVTEGSSSELVPPRVAGSKELDAPSPRVQTTPNEQEAKEALDDDRVIDLLKGE